MNAPEYKINGFFAAAVSAGIKKNNGLDLGLIACKEATTAAGVFTRNKVRAAPVVLTERHISGGQARAVVANAGCANACTGAPGMEDALETADLFADSLNAPREEILVASTGVIGARLDMEKIRAAVPGLVRSLSEEGLPGFARAIMTTDSFPKLSSFEGRLQERPFKIVGIAKGAGMIMPDMATLLGFVLTDITISPSALKKVLSQTTDETFNRITVDGDTSTNDTLIAMASGTAGNREPAGPDLEEFRRGLFHVMDELAVMMVRDGEGASLVVHVKVRGAASADDAHRAARTVANSNLVKTAFCGRDANWGRILAALGRSDIRMQEDRVDISIDDILIVKGGLSRGADAEKAAEAVMREKDALDLVIDLHQGDHKDRVVTCDLTKEYIDINASYRT
jgi:glutamate N-acetyltransferase/amino-acid N-acetyltransferase